jgi:hypothetical protein
MTATQRWIEDALLGEWERASYFENNEDQVLQELMVLRALLDPLAWQAVGKTRGWRERSEGTFEAEMECWQAYWDTFFADLREQVTIEEALKSLETN